MSQPVTAAEAVEFLTANGIEVRHARLGSGWTGVHAIVSEQGDAAFVTPKADFHLFEFGLQGRLPGTNHFDGLATGARAEYRPDTLFLLPAGRSATVSTEEGRAIILQLMIARQVMDDVKREMLRGDADRADLLGFNGVFNPRMKAAAEAIHWEMMRPSAGGALMADAMAQALCVEIVRGWTTGSQAPEPAKATLSPAQLARALDAIEAGIEENPGLDAVAQAAGFSTFHFARAFKEATGQSPHQYLIDRRLARARQLIDEGMALSEVAYACGFASQAHMTTTFTKHLGLSPGRYRESQR